MLSSGKQDTGSLREKEKKNGREACVIGVSPYTLTLGKSRGLRQGKNKRWKQHEEGEDECFHSSITHIFQKLDFKACLTIFWVNYQLRACQVIYSVRLPTTAEA